MTVKFFALLTHQGAAKLANATALGTKLDLTHLAVGDGGGSLPIPDPAQTALKRETRRAAINLLTVDPRNTSQIIAEQVIPENEGGWWIKEIGLFDKDGTLIAVANCPETYKPQLQEGSGRTQTIRVILIVSSTDAVTLKIDPSVVLATRQYVDDAVIEVKSYIDATLTAHAASRDHPDATLTGKGFVQLSSATDSGSEAMAATPKAVKAVSDAAVKLAQNLADIPNKPVALSHLGGLNRTDLPVGIPQPWSTGIAPTGWLKCNGATFDTVRYPLLSVAYPNGILPDLRGEFIRGWDDGRGVDNGRGILSLQAQAVQRHEHDMRSQGAASGTLWGINDVNMFGQSNTDSAVGNGSIMGRWTTFPDSQVGNFAAETRPRNIVFNYIVRAA